LTETNEQLTEWKCDLLLFTGLQDWRILISIIVLQMLPLRCSYVNTLYTALPE